MNKYLCVCDLDDTLLTSKKKITWKSTHFIRKFCKDNYFIICTGRPFNGAYNYWKRLKINMPFITDNGGAIYIPKKDKLNTIFFTINIKTMKQFLSEIEPFIYAALSQNGNNIYIQNKEFVPDWLIHNENNKVRFIEGNIAKKINCNILIFNLWVKENNLEKLTSILNKYNDKISYRHWNSNNEIHSFEIFSARASKGNAMKYLAEKYHIENTIAFGDQLNDLDMLTKSKYGIAMINATEETKKMAKFISAKDNNHNGVVHYLKKNKLY